MSTQVATMLDRVDAANLVYRRQEDYHEAVDALRDAIDFDSDEDEIEAASKAVQHARERLEDAVSHYRELVRGEAE